MTTRKAEITIDLPFDDVSRLRIAAFAWRTVVVLAAPREDLDSLLKRPEMTHAGVYLLLGLPHGEKRPEAYIGEAENVRDRLKQHEGKDFWVTAFILTDKDQSLDKAHIRYLEGRLITESKAAGRYEIQNSQVTGTALRETKKEMVEEYLSSARQLLQVLGCELLSSSQAHYSEKASERLVTAAEFIRSLEALAGEITPKQRELLQVHYRANQRKLTVSQMAKQVGYENYVSVNSQYGRLGGLVGKYLGLKEASTRVGALVEFIEPNTEGNSEWIWVMRPELAKALESLHWV